jgi:hypothetical protein
MATETRILVHGAEVITEETDVETRVAQAGAQVVTEETDVETRVAQAGAQVVTEQTDIETQVAVAGSQVVSEETSLAARILQFGAQLVYIPAVIAPISLLGPRALGAAVVAVALTIPSLTGPLAIGTPTLGRALQAPSLVNASTGVGDHYVVDANTLVAASLVGTLAVGQPTVSARFNVPSIVRTAAVGADALVIDDQTLVSVSLVGARAMGVAEVVQVAVPRTLRFRAAGVEYGQPGIIVVKAVSEDPGLYSGYVALGGTPSGGLIPKVVGLAGSTRLIVFDSVLLRPEDNGIGYYLAVSGYNPPWTGAIIAKSIDDGQTYTDIATMDVQSCIGYARTALLPPATLDVHLVRPDIFMLSSESQANVLNGANAAALIKINGDVEIIQWTTAVALGSGIYRLSNLLRGRRGSEFAVADHMIGEPFVVLDPLALHRISASGSEIGAPQIFRATSLGSLFTDANEVHFTL